MKIFAETERLILRELLPTDAEGMFELDSSPEVHRYVGKNPVKAIEESNKVIEFIREQYISNGIGRWAVIEKESGNFIGWSGLKLFRETVNQHTDFYDLGYRFIEKYWGKGYATESAVAVRDYGLNTLNLTELYAMTHPENQASQNVLEKIGFKLVKTFKYDGVTTWVENGEETNWHELKL